MPEKLAAGRAALLERGWLARTPPTFQEAVLDIAVWRTAEAGTEFVHAGDIDAGMFGIASGVIAVSFETGHPDTRFVHLAHSGFWGGNRGLLGKPRNLSITARSDVLWALIPLPAMKRLLADTPENWRHIALMSDMAYETAMQILVDLTRHHGLQRAAATVLRLAGCRNLDPVRSDEMEIQVSQGDIAALAVMSRNTLGTYLSEMAHCGLIELGYRTVRIVDAAGLRNLLDREE